MRPSKMERFMDKVELIPFHTCWEWTGHILKKGYGTFWENEKGFSNIASRSAYELFVGAVPDGKLVCHSCDNPSCVNPRHLWLGEPIDNSKDMLAKGREAKGLRQAGRRRLSVEDVVAMRKKYRRGEKGLGYKALAKEFDVAPTTARCVLSRKTWWYVEDECAVEAMVGPDWASMEEVK